jgi:hypothetical protein
MKEGMMLSYLLDCLDIQNAVDGLLVLLMAITITIGMYAVGVSIATQIISPWFS